MIRKFLILNMAFLILLYDNKYLKQLQMLWKQVRYYNTGNFFNTDKWMGPSIAIKSSFIVNTPLLKNHVIFLINNNPDKKQWYEKKAPEGGGPPYPQMTYKVPYVMSLDGKYYGFADKDKFNEIINNENIQISEKNLFEYAKLFINLSSREIVITSGLKDSQIKSLKKIYQEEKKNSF